MKKDYPQKRIKILTKEEKGEIRMRIKEGDDNIYELAKKFGCSTSQIAGVKSDMTKKGYGKQ
jgi:transposase-like protein